MLSYLIYFNFNMSVKTYIYIYIRLDIIPLNDNNIFDFTEDNLWSERVRKENMMPVFMNIWNWNIIRRYSIKLTSKCPRSVLPDDVLISILDLDLCIKEMKLWPEIGQCTKSEEF